MAFSIPSYKSALNKNPFRGTFLTTAQSPRIWCGVTASDETLCKFLIILSCEPFCRDHVGLNQLEGEVPSTIGADQL